MQTEVISNELNPVWNFTGEMAGFMDGDILRFSVMDKDTFPKPDDFLGKAELSALDFYPHGFHGELTLAESKTQATLTVMIVVIGCDEAAPELVEGEAVQTTMEMEMEGSVLPSGIVMQGLQVYNPGVPTTTTTTSHSMTYSAPQAAAVPRAYSTPQVPMNDMENQSMPSQCITYEAPQAPVPSESVAAAGNVIVHPPVTITAEEFAKLSGNILAEPLPVTAGLDTVGAGTKREVHFNDTGAENKAVKIKKKKSKRCC